MLWNFISFCPKNLPYQKNMIPQQKMWSGCYRLLPPTQKRSEFGPWQSLSRDVLGCLVLLKTKNTKNKNVFKKCVY